MAKLSSQFSQSQSSERSDTYNTKPCNKPKLQYQYIPRKVLWRYCKISGMTEVGGHTPEMVFAFPITSRFNWWNSQMTDVFMIFLYVPNRRLAFFFHLLMGNQYKANRMCSLMRTRQTLTKSERSLIHAHPQNASEAMKTTPTIFVCRLTTIWWNRADLVDIHDANRKTFEEFVISSNELEIYCHWQFTSKNLVQQDCQLNSNSFSYYSFLYDKLTE